MGFNYNKLKGLIREKCGTQARYASLLGISTTTLNQKLTNKSAFTQKEIAITKDSFSLTPTEIDDIFFTHS